MWVLSQIEKAGDQLLKVDNLTVIIEGEKILDNISFTIKKGQKTVFLAKSEVVTTALFKVIMGELKPDSGKFEWGITTSRPIYRMIIQSFLKMLNLILSTGLDSIQKIKLRLF